MTAAAAASIALLPLAAKAVTGTNWNVLYATTNLAGHALAYEPNPGTTGGPPCSLSDVSLSVFADYGTVTANANHTNIFVNAIGYRKFIETYTNGQAVSLGIYRYRGSLRLPAVPAPSVVQTQNAQTVQMMIQVWDGREKLWDSNSNSLEATMYWDLNPWNADFGKVKIYTMNTGALALVNTGITVPPDTNWHTFELVADFSNRTFVSAGMDGIVVTLSTVSIAQVTHTDWSTNVAISMTAESMNTWPGDSFTYVFWWTTEFRGLDFARQEYVADTETPVPNPMTWFVPPVPMNGTSITMTASAASDDAGVVYYFEEITGGAGGSSSGWQESPSFTNTGLVSGTRYSYRVKARDKSALSNETAYSEIYSAVTPLSAPVGVTASDGTYTSHVAVSWAAVDGAVAYEVWRGTASNSALSAKNCETDLAWYHDSSAEVAVVYYYWIKGRGAATNSPFSDGDSGYVGASHDGGAADLALESMAFLPAAPAGGAHPSAMMFMLVNHGPDALEDSSVLFDVCLSSNTTWGDDDDRWIGDCQTNVTLAAGSFLSVAASEEGLVHLTVPSDLVGNYHVLATVRHGSGISDPAVSNNCTMRSGAVALGGAAGLKRSVGGDYDGDAREDPALYQETTGNWEIRLSAAEYYSARLLGWGGSGYVPAAADFDGDRKTDPAVYHEITGAWHVWLSAFGYAHVSLNFGGFGCQPVRGDFNGLGQDDVAVFQPVAGQWSFLPAEMMAAVSVVGDVSDGKALPGDDYDGDIKADLALYEQERGTWRVMVSGSGYVPASIAEFGGSGFNAVPGDYDGDGKADLMVYGLESGDWHALLSGSGYAPASVVGFGGYGYDPIAGDFDGDGKADLVVCSSAAYAWYFHLSALGYALVWMEW